MKKAITRLFIAVLGLGFLFVSLYFGVAFYYRKGFAFGTTVNGINLTGMTMEEAEQALKEHDSYRSIDVVDKNNDTYTIVLDNIAASAHFTN